MGEGVRGSESWRAFVMLSDEETAGRPLCDEALPERPTYSQLEAMINERFPSPRWARKLDEVDSKGLRFMRRGGGDN